MTIMFQRFLRILSLFLSSTSYTIIIVLVWTIGGGATSTSIKVPETIPAVFMFGDSIVDQGNNNNITTIIKCDYPPYGKDFMGGSTPTGRFSNGKTPPDLLVEKLGIKKYLPAYLDPSLQIEDLLTGVSFASGGSGYDPKTPKLVSVISLADQTKMFEEYISKLKSAVGEEETNHILAKSLFFVVAGTDDLANTYFTVGIRKLHYDVNSYTDLMLQEASSFLQGIYKLGARKIGVLGVPPIGCLPAQRTLAGGKVRGCVEKYNEATQLFNMKLTSQLDSLKSSSLSKASLIYMDIYNPVMDLIQYPTKHGLKVVDKGCCGTGVLEVVVLCNHLSSTCADESSYLFWDSYHPTEKAYTIIVNQIIQKYIPSFF